ncbi:MAG: hypothetical protein NZL85_11560, partial [Fimbriimonadales bacterium]|nr:hypothetical protein [Fimbriimonadales bacterium]
PDKYIESGSTVTMSLVWGARWRGALFRERGIEGLSNIEITPDLAAKLGAAYGSSLSRGSMVVVARDTFRASRMIMRAFIAGVLSTGVDVLDLRAMPLPITRYTIRASGAAGGVNIRVAPHNSRMTLLEFFDRRGVYLPRRGERKIEHLFFREDFARSDPDAVGAIHFASRAIEEYQDRFFQLLRLPLGGRRLRIVADFAFSRVAAIYPTILGQLGYEVISLNAYPDPSRTPRTPAEHEAFLTNLRQIVQALNADCGMLMENEGERLAIIDERGRAIEGARLLAVFARLMAQVHREGVMAVPVHAPSVIEALATPFGAEVVRTRADVRSLTAVAVEQAERLLLAGDLQGGFLFPEFHPGFDAMFAYVRLLEVAQQAGCSLAEIYDVIPPFALLHRSLPCPWEQKGRVMRHVAQQVQGRVETIDGLKVYTESGWALILPDASEPLIHLYAEAPTESDAERLLEQYTNLIESGLVKE